MDMSFVSSKTISHILFKDWSVSSIGGLVGSCIAIVVIAIFFESLKSYKGPYRKRLYRRDCESIPLIRRLHKNENRLTLTDHLKKTFLFVVRFLVGYFLMLVAMTYNVWLFLAVVIGCGLGYFLATPFMQYYIDGRKKTASRVLDNYGNSSSLGATGTL